MTTKNGVEWLGQTMVAPATSYALRAPLLRRLHGVQGLEWLGVIKDPAACEAEKNELANLTQAMTELNKDLVSANVAISSAQAAGADAATIAGLEAQRQTVQSAFAANQAQIAQLTQKMGADCAEVQPSGPPPEQPECGTAPDGTVIPCADPSRECVAGKCVPKKAATGSTSNWGLAALGLAAAGGIFFAFRGLGKDLPKQEHRDNPRRRCQGC